MDKPLNVYLIDYEGRYLGGFAVAVAESEADALATLRSDPKTGCLRENAQIRKLDTAARHVAHNDDGDY